MTGLSSLSALTVQEAVARIGDGDHCQAGGTIGLSAALAAALAQATANSTLANAPTPAQVAPARAMQSAMAAARAEFTRLADQDANAILEFVALEEQGAALAGYALLCDGPRDLAAAAIAAAQAMQDYRAHVGERSRDDLEFALTLMAGAAHSALLLLDSNLRIWPLPELLARYQPEVTRLGDAVATLRPVHKIRNSTVVIWCVFKLDKELV